MALLPHHHHHHRSRRLKLGFALICTSLLLLPNPITSTKNPKWKFTQHQQHPDEELSKVFMDCLNAPIEFLDKDEETKCNTILDSLSSEELNIAARTSYAYWHLEERHQQKLKRFSSSSSHHHHQQQQQHLSSELQRRSALREIQRHLKAVDGHLVKAIERIKDVCQYRKDHQIDLLRVAFSDSFHNRKNNINHDFDESGNKNSTKTAQQMRQYVQSDMTKQAIIMRKGPGGHNDNNHQPRPIMWKYPRRKGGTTESEYVMTQLFAAEKSNAVVEYMSKGKEQSIMAIFDFSSMSSKHSPALSWQITALQTIQHLYPERLQKLVVLEPPLWIRGLFISIKPFMSKTTSNKIQIVTDRSKLCGEILDCDDDGNNLATIDYKEVDIDQYLNKIPFHCPYGDCRDGIDSDSDKLATTFSSTASSTFWPFP